MKSLTNATDLFFATAWLTEWKDTLTNIARNLSPDDRKPFVEKAQAIQEFTSKHLDKHTLRPFNEVPDRYKVEEWLIELKEHYTTLTDPLSEVEELFKQQKINAIQSYVSERLNPRIIVVEEGKIELYGIISKTEEENLLDIADANIANEIIEVWLKDAITDTSEYDSFLIVSSNIYMPFTKEVAKKIISNT